jgi:hypothetical protein
VTAAIVVGCVAPAMIRTASGFSRPLQVSPARLAQSAHPRRQG